ncbi:MAG TPA: hypothetical protein VMW16_00005, partial [Sedimentisphaerales bacterium]|nr:hypothetical protein [Sedimentisphaerales bacterium]
AKGYAEGLVQPNGGCGAASMLIAYGLYNANALYRCGLGLTLPVGRLKETFRTEPQFAGDKAGAHRPTDRPYENPPRNAGSRQGSLFRS